jgi:hypothetical protein
MMEYLNLSDSKAAQVIRSLIREGYVVRNGKVDGEIVFEFTDRGSLFVRASGARRVARTTADRTLLDFMARVKEVNGDPSFLYEVTDVIVFGSYLRDVGNLGDLDVVVRLSATQIADCGQ